MINAYSNVYQNNIEANNIELSIYPNPAIKGEEIRISYKTKNSNNVSISIYDILGNEIKEISDYLYETDTINSCFKTNNISSGIYYLQVLDGEKLLSKPIIIYK